MTKIRVSGPIRLRLISLAAISRIAVATWVRHLAGRRMAPDWDANFEIGIRYVRHQFTAAMRQADIAEGRLLFDSLQPETDDDYAVEVEPCDAPPGQWYRPRTRRSGKTLLYFHGGGYTFHSSVSARFAAMLAHRIGADLFACDYRLTPEHPHPAQAEDALEAWLFLTRTVAPRDIVVIGDSAGGHMALMLLQTLKARSLPQPGLCVGLCPWTDIGERGASLRGNDRHDLVQGWMALQFGRWLDPAGRFGREALSPIYHDFSGLAPIYLQAGGREVLHDMIAAFAEVQKARGATVTLDVWPDMPHNFLAFDRLKASSIEALERLAEEIGRGEV